MSGALAPQLKALGFVRNPFPQTPDADCYFRTPAIERQMAEVGHCLLTGKGFVLMTGEVGTGKSTFLRTLIDQLLEAGCQLAYVFNTFLKGRDLLLAINRDFGLAPGMDMADDLDRLNRFLIEVNARGQTCVVLIDDAQNFDIATLELVRLLSNLETRQHKLLQIVLAGQPELAQLLAQPSIRQLASRIVQHVQLTPFSAHDCGRYIAFRMAGCIGDADPVTLTDAARHALYRHAGGNPRKMHLILDRSLYGAVTQERRSIDAPLIEAAAGEAGLTPPRPLRRGWTSTMQGMRSASRAGIAAVLAGCSVALAAWAVVDERPAATAGTTVTAIPTPLPTAPLHADLDACLAGIDASVWQPVLATGPDAATRDALAAALATRGLALAALAELPAPSRMPAPHCVLRSQSAQDDSWLLWRPSHAPFALQTGAPHAAVLWLQTRLAAAGFYHAALDGLPGPHSRQALRQFRASHGQTAVALLDGGTLLLLEQVGARAEPEARMTKR